MPGRASGHKTLLQPQSLARTVREGVRLGLASGGQGENCESVLLACGGYRWKGLFCRPAAKYYRGPDPCVVNMDGCLTNWRKSHFPFLCQYATGCHLRMGLWGAHPRPPHYGASLTNSFSQWSSVAPISCLFF